MVYSKENKRGYVGAKLKAVCGIVKTALGFTQRIFHIHIAPDVDIKFAEKQNWCFRNEDIKSNS